jgi:hypothetical protein
MAHDVFISHSSKDKLTADAICHALEQNSIRCWIAPRDVRPGETYGAEIIGAIKGCRVFLLVFSENANASEDVANEIQNAFKRLKTIIPYRLDSSEMSDEMDYFLSRKHWIDAYPNDTVFSDLVTATRDALKGMSNTDGTTDGTPPTETEKTEETEETESHSMVMLFDLDWHFEQNFHSTSASTASEIKLADGGTVLVLRNDFYEIRKAKTQLTLEPASVYGFTVDVRMEGYERYPKDAEAYPELTAGAVAVYESYHSKDEKVHRRFISYNEEKWARIRWNVYTSNEKRAYALWLQNGLSCSACKGTAYFRNFTYRMSESKVSIVSCPSVRLFDLDWQFEQRFQSTSASTASEIELTDGGTTLVLHNDFYENRCVKTQLTLEPDSVYDFTVDVRMEGYERYPKDAETHPEVTAGAGAAYQSYYSKDGKVYWWGNSYNEEKWTRIRWKVHTSNEKRAYEILLENGGTWKACKGTAYFRNLTYKKT